jgi:hypothetical protein
MPNRNPSFAASALILTCALSGCSGANRQLQSLSISAVTAVGVSTDFSAVGAFTASPTPVDPLPASWYLFGPGLDPPPPAYTLVSGAFDPQRCSQVQAGSTTTYTVVALAPADPDAPSSGSVPNQVFQDLVLTRSRTSEGGFIAATTKLVCPQ